MFSREKTLQKARDQLGKFIQDPVAGVFIASVLSHLTKLETLPSNGIDENEISELRKSINGWLDKNKNHASVTVINNIKLIEALHSALVAIAAAKPLNVDDPMTLDAVDESDRIVTSDGLQFDATTLLSWINSKHQMRHPKYNTNFGEYDQKNIKAYAVDKKITLHLSEHVTREIEDPSLLIAALANMGLDAGGRPISPEQQANTATLTTNQLSILELFLSHFQSQHDAHDHVRVPHTAAHRPRVSRWNGSFSASQHLGFDLGIPTQERPQYRHYYSPTISSSAAAAAAAAATVTSSNTSEAGSAIMTGSNRQSGAPMELLPSWLSCSAAARLPNGYIAAASKWARLRTPRTESGFNILIINPANCEIVRRIANNDDRISGITLLENGNIAVTHHNRNANINIYNPETGERLKEIPQSNINIQERLTHASGNNIIIFNNEIEIAPTRGEFCEARIYDIEAGYLVRKTPIIDVRAIGTSLAIGDKWVVFDYGKLVVLDSNFQVHHIVNHESIVCYSGVATTLTNQPDQVAMVQSSQIMIYDITAGTLIRCIRPDINVIHSMISLGNGNLVVAGAFGLIKEYTVDGRLVSECQTNQNDIDSPILLKLAYEQLAARHALANTGSVLDTAKSSTSTPLRTEDSAYRTTSIFSHTQLNAEMMLALNELSGVLTSDHLQDWLPTYPFTSIHREVLVHLVRNVNIPVERALITMKGLNEDGLRDLLPPGSDNSHRMDEVD